VKQTLSNPTLQYLCLRHKHIRVVEIGKRNLSIFCVQKGGPPKIGGPVRPYRLNVPKAGAAGYQLMTGSGALVLS